MKSVLAICVATGLFWLSSSARAEGESGRRIDFDVAAQPLPGALNAFAAQSNLNILFEAKDTEGCTSEKLVGNYTAQDALRRLLANSSLQYEFVDDHTVEVHSARVGPASSEESVKEAALNRTSWIRNEEPLGIPESAAPVRDTSSAASDGTVTGALDNQVIVTGTRIRGAQPSSPVVTLTRVEMEQSGQHSLGEVIRGIPQNFSGGQNPGVVLGATSGRLSNQNTTGASSFNLRGLGADATLTLLNGARLPYDGFFQATDVSVVPVAAIDRVEILLDGASAIYGTDAVAGVANVVLRRDYEGIEVSTRFGTATDGGFGQKQYSLLSGHTWQSGSALATADYSDSAAIRASDRNYLSYMPFQDVKIYPDSTQKSALLSGYQKISDSVELDADAFYLDRHQNSLDQPFGTTRNFGRADSSVWGFAPLVKVQMPADWTMSVRGALGRSEGESASRSLNAASAVTAQSRTQFSNKAQSASIEGEGPLVALRSGELRLAVGGGYRKNEFEQRDLQNGTLLPGGEDRSNYAFSEISVPVLSPKQAIPFVHSLVVSGAVRFEDYDSFGHTTTPKFGAIWSLSPTFDLKATWGRSFKVPTLYEQNTRSTAAVYPGFIFNAPAVTSVLFLSGGNAGLTPERAEVTTAGFSARPVWAPDLKLELSWFDVDYTDRVAAPLAVAIATPGQVFSDPAIAPLIVVNPTAAQQNAYIAAVNAFFNLSGSAYDPARVYAVLDNRYTNTAEERMRGLDLDAAYQVRSAGGVLTATAYVSWVLNNSKTLTPNSPKQEIAGIAFFPAKFKGRFGGTWSRENLTISSHLNVIGGVKSSAIATTGPGSSMTTVDLALDYDWASSPIGALGVNFAALNLLDKSPPSMQPPAPNFVNYDSTNYSALGRVLSVTLTKRF